MLDLHSVKWDYFKLTEIFPIIQRGKRLKKSDHLKGTIPYVSSTSSCNGIDGFVGNTGKVRVYNDCLTIANSGSVGSTFFHPYSFVASDHVTELKREGLDRYAYLFLAALVKRLTEKYSFNREINDDRIKREFIKVPITNKGEINFEFMSSYMREKETIILKSTIDKLCTRLIHNTLTGGVILFIQIGNHSHCRKYSPFYRASA